MIKVAEFGLCALKKLRILQMLCAGIRPASRQHEPKPGKVECTKQLS